MPNHFPVSPKCILGRKTILNRQSRSSTYLAQPSPGISSPLLITPGDHMIPTDGPIAMTTAIVDLQSSRESSSVQVKQVNIPFTSPFQYHQNLPTALQQSRRRQSRYDPVSNDDNEDDNVTYENYGDLGRRHPLRRVSEEGQKERPENVTLPSIKALFGPNPGMLTVSVSLVTSPVFMVVGLFLE